MVTLLVLGISEYLPSILVVISVLLDRVVIIFCPVVSIFRGNGALDIPFIPIVLFPTGNIVCHSLNHVPVDPIGDEINTPDPLK
jgi:hypothetical protein